MELALRMGKAQVGALNSCLSLLCADHVSQVCLIGSRGAKYSLEMAAWGVPWPLLQFKVVVATVSVIAWL